MPNGAYGRFIPRLAMAVADYVSKFGEWPTYARGTMMATLLLEPGEGSDPHDVTEFSPELAERIRSRMTCETDVRTELIELRGPLGRSKGYGNTPWDAPTTADAYRWLYGEDPP